MPLFCGEYEAVPGVIEARSWAAVIPHCSLHLPRDLQRGVQTSSQKSLWSLAIQRESKSEVTLGEWVTDVIRDDNDNGINPLTKSNA